MKVGILGSGDVAKVLAGASTRTVTRSCSARATPLSSPNDWTYAFKLLG